MHASLESLFTRYRQSGRPEPLGEVFDRSSPQLLALALHLCSHPADAEDALQATFVAAIDGAATWNAQKPLLPWLLGILTNQCRRIGERRARRREEALPSEPLLLDDGTPLAASERHDLIARLREHIDRLPTEQRQVLLLQLEHGLAPAEVAEVLGVPPGTVRMRLHRGLQTLRSVLPAGLVALLLAALPSRGVAAVRAVVVGHAAAGIALLAGNLLVKKLLAGAVVLVLLGLGVSALAPVWSAPPPPANAPAVLQQAALPRNHSADAGALARTEVPSDASNAPTSATTGSIAVRSRTEDGKPIPNLPFRYSVEEGEMAPIGRVGITDANGLARIDDLAEGNWRIELFFGAKPKHANVVEGAIADVEFVLPSRPPYTLRGTVLHATGQPAARATVVVGGISGHGAAPCGLTDDAGRFAVELGTNLGVGACLAGYAPSALMYCYPRETITLVLGGPEALVQGAVVDEAGRPVTRALVEVGPRDSWVPEPVEDDLALPPAPQVATTDAAGSCSFRGLVEAQLRVRIRASGFAAFEGTVETVAGTTQRARWQLIRGIVLQGTVVDEDRRAVRAYVSLPDTNLGRQCAEDGSFHFANVPANVAEIEVGARGFVRRRVDAAAARAGAEPIVLQRWPRYALRLVDERGEPLAGWLVSLMPRYEGSTTTNERGVVAVGAKTFAAPRLLVSPPGTAEQAVVPLPWPASATPGAACDVVVPDILVATASVYGVVVAPDGTSIADAHAELRSPAGLLFAMQRAPGGEFHFAHVPAGDWQLWIQRGNRHVFDPPVPITLAKGEDCDAGVIRAPAEGSLRVTVRTASGRRPAGLRFLLDNTHGEDTDFPVDGQHHELPAGTYRWIAVVEDACWRAGDVEVRASERRELEVVLPPGSRRDLFIALPGAGLAEGFVDWSLRADDGMLAYRERTPMTVEDRIELHPNLSPGTWHVDVAAGDGRRFTGSFEIAALGPSPAAIHVALTAVR